MDVIDNNSWVKRVREQLQVHGKYGYLRRAVWGLLGLDVLLTFVFISVSSAPSTDIKVWFETGVPSNFIMVKTFSDTHLEDVEIVLDGLYFFTKSSLAAGTSGLPIESVFLSADETVPVDGYRPRHVELKIDGEHFKFDLGRSEN